MEDNPRISDEVLEKNLDRIIGFVANCDSKVSYLLSAIGIILTVLLAIKPTNLTFIKSAFYGHSDKLYWFLFLGLVGLALSSYYFLKGIHHLSQSLMARTEIHSENSSSMIFFGAILAQRDGHNYLQNIEKNEYSYREDLASQIYVNSEICTEKFKRYNKGFKHILFSIPFLVIFWSYVF